VPTHRSVSSAQRGVLLRSYRERGHTNRNLCLGYSVKTDRDWIFPSSRHFLHWIAYLETDRQVETFELASALESSDASNAPRGGGLDARVSLVDGRVIWHKIGVQEANESGLSVSEKIVRVVTDEEIRSRSLVSMRWLKVICFAGALRGERQAAVTAAVLQTVRSQRSGLVRNILEPLRDYDDAIVKGVIGRLAIKDALVLNLLVRQ
jgi:hypothetical protein